ncbi:MAG: YIP1 family protein [Defluviitaleaceae bacterium]|nr:YIP1 family protein [Defluviitaleaceae bacterium]
MNEELTRVVEPEIIKMGVVQRVIAIFTSPTELMKNIKAYPVILIPFLLAVVIGLIGIVPGMRMSELMTEEMSAISIERFGVDHFDMSGLADEYGELDLQGFMDAVMFVSFIFSAFITPMIISFFSALGLFILSKIMRGPVTFGQMFSMYIHVYVIAAIGALVISAMMAATGRYLDVTSLAAVFSSNGDISMVSHNILSGIGIFTIWPAILTFIGVKVLNDFCNVKAGIITAIAFIVGLGIHVSIFMSTWWMLDLGLAMGL